MQKKKREGRKPLILIILDGWGIAEPNKGNAVLLAKTPNIDAYLKEYPQTELQAHSHFAGLPLGQVGNSEAGHMNIGAGRLVEQDSVIISKSIADGTFYKNPAFLGAIRHINKMDSRLHLVGMLSNGQSPHSDPGHLIALLDLARREKVRQVFLHLITDGRDSPKYASLGLMADLERKHLKKEKIASIMGRYYAMDRTKKWDRTEAAYNALVNGEGKRAATAQAAITESYNRDNSDEYIEPYVIDDGSGLDGRIREGDSVVFFNLRSDRSRQLSKVFVQENFTKMNPGSFKRRKRLEHLYFVAMTDFGPDLDDIITAYPSIDLRATLPMQLSGLKQLYIAETEKYAHVTYFFNGGYTGKVAGEDQLIIPSPDVRSYDQTPAMSSHELTKKILSFVQKKEKRAAYDVIILNFAAPDMVGHTGNLKAAITCCEEVDRCVGQIVEAYLSIGGEIIISADHGNIEKMINLETDEIFTEHTTNPVPFILISQELKNKNLRKNGILGDIAPTMLDLLGFAKPEEMSGKSLII
jgi:2,3-bisphosphoglycerate-independent phosphoglycerate mutase